MFYKDLRQGDLIKMWWGSIHFWSVVIKIDKSSNPGTFTTLGFENVIQNFEYQDHWTSCVEHLSVNQMHTSTKIATKVAHNSEN